MAGIQTHSIFMPVLVTCQFDDDPTKNKGAIHNISSGAQRQVTPKWLGICGLMYFMIGLFALPSGADGRLRCIIGTLLVHTFEWLMLQWGSIRHSIFGICCTSRHRHDVIIIGAAAWQNQQSECAPSEDSDQHGHPPSLIRVFAVRMKNSWVLSYPLSAQRRLRSDWANAQADLSLRWAHTHFVLSCRGSFAEVPFITTTALAFWG